jgi:hypothetical protein
MNDGRFLSNWEPNQTLVDKIAVANGFNPGSMDNNQFRQWLQNNGNALRAAENSHLQSQGACPRVVRNIPIMRPYAEK